MKEAAAMNIATHYRNDTTTPMGCASVEQDAAADEFSVVPLKQLLSDSVRCGSGVWWAAMARQVEAMDEALQYHRAATEGGHGLHAEVLLQAPRLAPRLTQLDEEHSLLAEHVLALRGAIADAAGQPGAHPDVIASAEDVIDQIRSHQSRAYNVVLDATNVDIGGE